MQASPMRFLNLIGENKVVFKIPVYQRNYEWNKEQVEQFFLDIEKIIESDFQKNHFLGTIVFVSREIENLFRERILIDGQQRLTTTILLLKAISDIVVEDQLDFITVEEINETFLVNKHSRDQSKLKLKPVEGDMKAYEDLMNDTITDSKIYKNYSHLKDLIRNSNHTVEEIYRALSKIDIVYISLDNDENPQVIFESLNSTGLSLTQADLIRNFILMGRDYDTQTRLYKKYWLNIEKYLPNAIISDFVRDYLTMKEGIVPNKNKVYSSFKNYYFNNEYDAEEILVELLEFAEYYYYIMNSNCGIKSIDKQLENINIHRTSTSYPYILKLFHLHFKIGKINQEELIQILETIVSYIYRRNICNLQTSALNKIFATMSRESDSREKKGLSYVEAAIDYLMSRTGSGIFPRNDEFRNNFINTDIYNRSNSLAKITLYKLESYNHKELVNIEDLSVEHIMPQVLNPEWHIELGKNSYDIHRLHKDTIGNLTLTNYNSEMSNSSFARKKKFYQNSNIKITRQVAEDKKWQKEEILNRAEEFFERAKNIWKLPVDNYQSIGEERLIPNEQYGIKDNVIVTGYTPKAIIFDNEKISVTTWKSMLIVSCRYLYDLDEDLFISLKHKSNFKNMLSYDSEKLSNPELIRNGLYIRTGYSAKDILNYIVLLTQEFGLDDLVFFEIA